MKKIRVNFNQLAPLMGVRNDLLKNHGCSCSSITRGSQGKSPTDSLYFFAEGVPENYHPSGVFIDEAGDEGVGVPMARIVTGKPAPAKKEVKEAKTKKVRAKKEEDGQS